MHHRIHNNQGVNLFYFPWAGCPTSAAGQALYNDITNFLTNNPNVPFLVSVFGCQDIYEGYDISIRDQLNRAQSLKGTANFMGFNFFEFMNEDWKGVDDGWGISID